MEKTIKIMWENQEVEIVLKQLTWGEHKKIREQSIVLKEYNGQPMQFRNMDLLDDLKILSSIKSAPFEINMTNIDALSEKERNKILVEVLILDGGDNVKTD